MSWKDDKNLGPWTFTKKENKPSYNEGDHIATYASPVWSMTEGSNLPITPTHKPCGYWTKDYVSPWTPPKGSYLIGWYKFDEGSGLVVNNYATGGSSGGGLLPNLTVFNSGEGLFWSYLSGFGSTPQLYFGAGSGVADFAWSKPNRTIGGASKLTMGIFVKRKNDAGNKGGYTLASRSAVYGGTLGTRLFTCNQRASQGYSWQWNVTPGFAYDVNLIDVWLLHFIDSNGYYRIVKPDGTILTSATAITLTTAIQYIYALAGVEYIDADPPTKGYYPGGSSYGDWIIYNSTTLSLSDWGSWYDQLRSRYGMSPRSGW